MKIFDLAAAAARTLDPETAHTLTIKGLSRTPVPAVRRRDDARLAVTLPVSGLRLRNPVGLAAGFDKNAEVSRPMLAFGFGFIECGTVTPKPQPGNDKPRLFRLTEDQAVINRMGFNNDGLGPFTDRLARHKHRRGPVGANVGANKDSGDRISDYVTGIRTVWPFADYLTINISSPNTPGLRGLQDRGALEDLLGRTGETILALEAHGPKRPVFLKVAPDLDEAAIGEMTDVVASADRLDGLIVSNTTIDRPDSLRSVHKGEAGGLSGGPLFGPSTDVLRQFAIALGGRFDLIGVGGIASGADAYAKIRAGAHAVQLYSAMAYAGPSLVTQIKRDLAARLKADGFASVSDAVGADLS